MLWSMMRLIFKTSSVTPDIFYVFNLILSFSTCSESYEKICALSVSLIHAKNRCLASPLTSNLQSHPPSLIFRQRKKGIEWSLRTFASTSSCQIFLASSEHFKKYRWHAACSLEKYTEMVRSEHFEYVLGKFSPSRNLSFINRIRCFARRNS